jgi:DNA-binding MarR family transcriptional regulator
MNWLIYLNYSLTMATQYDERILRSLRRISRAIDIYSRQLAAQHRLTGPQLMCLHALSRKEPRTSGELAKTLDLSQATVTGILDRLETRELVTRVRDQRDKRRVLVSLTEVGRQALSAAPAPLHDQFAARLAQLSEVDQAQINRVLEQVVAMMSADDLDAAPILTAGPATAAAGEVVEFLSPEPTDDDDDD